MVAMKAITYTRYGPPEVLELADVPAPAAGPGEIRIRVRAVEVTKADCEMRSFDFAVKWFTLPLRLAFGVTRPRQQILGSYFAGEVESLGEGVSRFAVGDAVFGAAKLKLGAYAEYVVLPESYTIVGKPANMSFAEAAAVPLGGLNALHFMRLAAIEPGTSLLINGAGGSIGTHAVQIARRMGATVTCVDKAIKAPILERLGANEFIDYTRQDFRVSGRRWDVIFDMVPRGSYAGCIRALNPGGRYLAGNPRLSVMLRTPLTNWFTDRRASFALAAETCDELEDLRQMIERGEIVPIVDRVMPIEDVVAAHRLVEAEERLGAIVLSVT
jgi:NADPH:quinone reductase-like Zn-dependent oxidoreductase